MEEEYFPIGEAAKLVGMTSETLRHYDRIGLVKPSRTDPQTQYRYYTAKDIVRLNTVHALRQMDLPLQEIQRVLEYDDLEAIIAFLKQAEQKADEKIAALQQSKLKIQWVRSDYEKKLQRQQAAEGIFVQKLPERVILLADPGVSLTVDNLWNYHRHFYSQLEEPLKERFAFEDLAGVYTEGTSARLFAVCTRYEEIPGLKVLPAGRYLCASCTHENREEILQQLMGEAEKELGYSPLFSVQLVVISGILQWKYQLQAFVGP